MQNFNINAFDLHYADGHEILIHKDTGESFMTHQGYAHMACTCPSYTFRKISKYNRHAEQFDHQKMIQYENPFYLKKARKAYILTEYTIYQWSVCTYKMGYKLKQIYKSKYGVRGYLYHLAGLELSEGCLNKDPNIYNGEPVQHHDSLCRRSMSKIRCIADTIRQERLFNADEIADKFFIDSMRIHQPYALPEHLIKND